MKKLVISTGAGISAESGLSTFRDAGGLWDKYKVVDVASADGFARNPALIHEFYNTRRRELLGVNPNEAHIILAEMEKDFDIEIITQNIDNLHERAGSTNVLHLHGELMKARSIKHPERLYDLSPENPTTSLDSIDKYGDHLRPHIVFFQEAVPNIEQAIHQAMQADIFVVIGTSLNVYPAASLLNYVPASIPIYYIDPSPAITPSDRHVTIIAEKATQGVATLRSMLTGK
ncbi:MAG: Sir2 family NAD-dependent protein deacetylase [Muribaculaceae bacterium]